MNRLNKTKSAVFLYCRFSLLLKEPFFPDYLEVATAVVVPGGVGNSFQHTSIYFLYSVPTGILGSDG